MIKHILNIVLVFAFLNTTEMLYAQQFRVDTTLFKKHLFYLASDSLEGRGTGTKGARLAAEYIAGYFESIGLLPYNSNGYFQNIPMHGNKTKTSSKLKIKFDDIVFDYTFPEDYVMYKTGQHTFNPVPKDMVFAGYGIYAPEYDYSDYHNIDVAGKIVVILEGEPYSTSIDYFRGVIPTVYSYPESKMRLSLSMGASGCIIIPNPYDRKVDWNHIKKEFFFEDVNLAYSVAYKFGVMVNPKNAYLLFKDSGYTIDDVFENHYNGNMVSFPLKGKLTFKGDFLRRDFIGRNIIGWIEGTDPHLKDEAIIVSAHYDHLGIGTPVNGDSVYNGVLDNAMGSCAVLETANILKKLNPKRSVVFILVTGEEKGLLGSKYYVDNPLFPLYKTVANINIDGLAYFDEFSSAVAVGDDMSDMYNIVNEVLAENNLMRANIPEEFADWESFNRSDQIAFALAGITSMLMMEGPDAINKGRQASIDKFIDYNNNRYHMPGDDLTQEINYKAVAQHIDVLADLIIKLANSDEAPTWNANSPYRIIRLRNIAEKK